LEVQTVDPLEQAADALGFPLVTLPERASSSMGSAIGFLVDRLVDGGFLHADSADEVIKHLLKRERLGSTAIGGAFAMPHGMSLAVDRVVGILARCSRPVQWEAPDGPPVETVCLILGPAQESPGDYMHAFEKIAHAAKQQVTDRRKPS
jgi:mannitol/fructose-specific phosphotransferase system IIA component (Ntr-type)